METLKYIEEHGLQALETDLSIKIKEYDDLYVLNYNQIESPKTHPVVMECRSLILDKEFNIVSRSFDRFFNHGESGAGTDLDWTKCEIFEKVDGSLIKIYCHKGTWYVSTRGTAYADSQVGDFDLTFKDLVFKALDVETEEEFQDLCDDCLLTSCTYMFEVTSRENRVVTRYDDYKLWYLGTRYNSDGTYLDDCINLMTSEFGCEMPDTYSFESVEDMLEASKTLPDLAEGYVVYQGGVPVCKIKSPLYLAVHRIRGEGGLTNKRIMQLLLMNEQEEYLTYYPEDQKFFDPVKAKYDDLLLNIKAKWLDVKGIEAQKDFALNVKDFLYSAVLFQARSKCENPVHVWHSQADSYKLKVLQQWSNLDE